jgi:hypothetical protein
MKPGRSESRLAPVPHEKEGQMSIFTREEQQEQELSTADYLERALDELEQARREAAEEVRSAIDSAIGRSRDALEHLRTGAEDRAEHLKEVTEDRLAEMQRSLEEASDEARREFGIRTVRAQRSQAALSAMSEEIKQQQKELTASR